MPLPEEPKKELHSTYFVQDRSNEEEMMRVRLQDHMLTAGMGGPLPEQPDPSTLQRVLDVGCGTGDWLVETARRYPTIQLLIGVDISATMARYARAQVEDDAALAGRVEFAVMDALRMLEFKDDFFNLVNERLAASYLRTWDWRPYLDECIRVCRPGGVIRFTESNVPESNSPALNQLNSLFFQAFCRAGHYFTEDRQGVTTELPNLFKRHGLEDIQTREHVLHYLTGTEQGDLFIQDAIRAYRTARPFLKKWAQVPDNYDEIYQQAIQEMCHPDFEAIIRLLTIWGTVPRRNNDPQFLIVP